MTTNVPLNGNHVLVFFANLPTGTYMVASTEQCGIAGLCRSDMVVVTVDQNNPSTGFTILWEVGQVQTSSSGLPNLFWMVITPTNIFIKNNCTDPTAAANTVQFAIYKIC